MNICSIEGCERRHRARGWCLMHYKRWKRNGSPLAFFTPTSAGERFWSKVDKAGECWVWTGGTQRGGYGCFAVAGRTAKAHRFSYELLVGPIPEGLDIDHLCRNPPCVNPAHLEPVSHRTNVQRGESGVNHRSKTHCPHGHPYDEANTYFIPSRPGWRYCLACKRIYNRQWMRQRRADAKHHATRSEARDALLEGTHD